MFLWLSACFLNGWIQPARAQYAATSLPLSQVNGITWDATRARFFVGSGSDVLVIDPDAGQIVDTISVGAQLDQVALSDDGKYLYASLSGKGTIQRVRVQDHVVEASISLGVYTGGNTPRAVQAMIVLPAQPLSLLVGTNDRRLAVLDGSVPRSGTANLAVSALYARASDGAVFGIADDATYPSVHDQMFQFTLSSAGVGIAKAVPVSNSWSNAASLTWNRNLVVSRNVFESYVYDLGAGTTVGRLPLPGLTSTDERGCLVATDPSGSSAIAYQFKYQSSASITRLVQYSLPNLRPVASIDLSGIPPDGDNVSGLCGAAATWGTDGILIAGPGRLYFLHTSGMTPLPTPTVPTPTRDGNGAIHLGLAANGLVFDAGRNLLWASVPGVASSGNSVVSIDPGTGNIIDRIDAGSDPGVLALSADGSHLFAALGGAPAIESIDLTAKQGSAFSVLNAANSPYYLAAALAPVAGASNSVAAVRAGNGPTSVIAYDNGIARTETVDSGLNGNIYAQSFQAIFPADAPNLYYAVDSALHYGDGTHDVSRLILDSNGFKSDTQLNNLPLGAGAAAGNTTGFDQPVSLVYDSGRLYTSAGQIFTPDTKRLLGSVTLNPAYGLPVPFSDQGGIVYVQGYSPQVSATFYDSQALLPLTSIPLFSCPNNTCAGFTPFAADATAAVRAGNSIAVSVQGEIVIAPLTGFQTWPSATGAVQSVSTGVQEINLPVNAIAALPGTSKLLMGTPSRAGSKGNSIVTFNSATNRIESAGFIGSEPSLLAAAPDGSAAYAYLSGEYNLARFNIASGSRDLVFAADPTGGSDQQYGVFDMAMGPDGGLAVTSQNAFVGLNGGFDQTRPAQFIGIFDNGALRPQIGVNATEPATLELAFNDSGSRLYGFNSFLSSFELVRESVSAKGVQFLSSTEGLLSGYNTQIRSAHGLIYSSNGSVIDPEQLVGVGRFSDLWMGGAGNAVAPDPDAGRVYFATESGILVFNTTTYALIGRLAINIGDQNYPMNLVRFGSDGLALLTNAGQVYVVSIASIPPLATPVPTPQPPFIAASGVVPIFSSTPKIQPGSWISIFGRNLANQTALWNGDFPTSLAGTSVMINYKPAYLWYVSPTQINLQAPDDTFIGLSVQVSVTTATGIATSSVLLSQFTPSFNLFDDRHVAAEIVTPDGTGAYGGGTYDLAGVAGQFAFQSRPVRAGETLALYGVGFGPTTSTVPAGQGFSGAAPTTNPVTVNIGGQPAKVAFSGLVSAGLYQINVVVPNVASGDQPVQATVGGVGTPTAFVAVQ
jgi:uncharacterized protein (TIGR03437 family)